MRKNALLTLCVSGLLISTNALSANNYSDVNPQQMSVQTDNAMFDLLARVEQLQAEVQQLRGMVEEQSQTIADLERKQKNMYADLDGRVQSLATPAPVQPQVAPAQPTVSAAPATQASVTPTAPPTSVPNAVSAQNVALGTEKDRYQQAYDSLRNGHNAQAVKMFETLLADYPAGEYADNAQYWLAEAYKVNREIDKSRVAFTKVVIQYPNSAKVPDALLKLGYIEADMQNSVKAREYLLRVTNNYPNSPAAHLAAKKLAQMP
ncbi:MAG: tol-pal system protein YbgF [Methylomonas sp.]